MIAIKNADGTLVPIIDAVIGADRTVNLTLAHNQQTRADLLLYELDDSAATLHVRDLSAAIPFASLVLQDLPENLFGETTIQARLAIDADSRLLVEAGAIGGPTVSESFAIPSLSASNQADNVDMPEEMDFSDSDDLSLPEMTSFSLDDSNNLPELTTFATTDHDTIPIDFPAETQPEPMNSVEMGFIDDPDFESFDLAATPVPEAEPKPAKSEKPKTAKVERPVREASPATLGGNLMRASAGLFAVSLIEVGLYFLLRMHLI